jgi:hypothetical protein
MMTEIDDLKQKMISEAKIIARGEAEEEMKKVRG